MHRPARLRVEPLEDRTQPVVLPAGFSESLLVGGLTLPTSMAVAPDGDIFVAEKTGSLRLIDDGVLAPSPVLTVDTFSGGEHGLIGVALDPNFAATGWVYIHYTVPTGAGTAAAFNRVSRFTVQNGAAAPGSELVLLNLDPLTSDGHSGGGLQFGPDGKLYVAVGEDRVPGNSQSLDSRLGKILRINPDGGIPADNPATIDGLGAVPAGPTRAIWAAGLRNPFTFAFDPVDGRMFINDVGGQLFEEVNPGRAGANYGWPATEGDFDQAAFPNFTRPTYAYPHGGPEGSPLFGESVAGGAFYRAGAVGFPAGFSGDYFFGDFINGWINVLDRDTNAFQTFATDLTGAGLTDIDVAPNGDLLYLSLGFAGPGSGGVYRIRFAQAGGPGAGGVAESAVFAVGAAAGGATARLVDPVSGRVVATAQPFGPAFTGGVRVASADVTGDRVADLIAAAGPGGGPRVVVLDGVTSRPVRDFFAFEATFTGGLFVAAGDLDRDGFADMVITPDVGGGPRVLVVSGATGAVLADFFGIDDPNFRGGARAAVGDVNGDGFLDLIVAAGTGGGPRVAVWDGQSLLAGGTPTRLRNDFFAFEPSVRDGTFVTAGDADGDGRAELFVGGGPGAGPRVLALAGDRLLTASDPARGAVLADFFASDPAGRSGVTLATADLDGDGLAELLTGGPPGSPSVVSAFRVAGGSVTKLPDLPGLDDAAPGGVFVG